jgi:hypothetical protein
MIPTYKQLIPKSGRSWETESSSAVQKIPRILQNPKAYYRAYEIRPLALALATLI